MMAKQMDVRDIAGIDALKSATTEVLRRHGVELGGMWLIKDIRKHAKTDHWPTELLEKVLEAIRTAHGPLFKDMGGQLEHILHERDDLLFKLLVQAGVRKPGSLPGSRTQMLKDVRLLNTNIFDVLSCCSAEDFSKLRFFDTMKELRRYSIKEGKVFPREHAKDLSLRYLLKPFFA